jgi:hypothetical protein
MVRLAVATDIIGALIAEEVHEHGCSHASSTSFVLQKALIPEVVHQHGC